jgi:polar amino acid transport system permease protein
VVTAVRGIGTRRAMLVGCLIAIAFIVAGCGSGKGHLDLRWNTFWDDILRPDGAIINGLWLTVAISVIAQVLGVVLGTFAALGRSTKFMPFRIAATIYIWFFRGTPLLVQLVLFRFGVQAANLFMWPTIDLGPIQILPEILAGTLILGVNEGAYMAEIVRAGILAVDPGQTEAAKSLGMTYGKTMRRIVLPQAARVIIPPLGNEFNNMLKTTSLLQIIGVFELFNTFSIKYSYDFLTFEHMLAACVWYLLLTTIWGFVQAWIERRLSRGTGVATNDGPGWTARFLGRGRADAALGGH